MPSFPFSDPKNFRPVSSAGMRALDRRAAEQYGLPTLILMEHAGRAVALAVERVLRRPPDRRPVAIFCGGGNNGGDGIAAARHLFNRGRRVQILLDRAPDWLAGDALIQWNIARFLKIPFQIFKSRQKLLQFLRPRPAAAVDALLGTGFRGPLKSALAPLIDMLNDLDCPVVAVDVPSGLDADSGVAAGTAVKADVTVTLGLPKTGLLRPEAKLFTGKLRVADIGFPLPLVRRFIKA